MITVDLRNNKGTMGRLNKTAHVIQFSLPNSKGIMGYETTASIATKPRDKTAAALRDSV